MSERAQIAALAESMARAAGQIQRERYETDFAVRSKGASIDLVTEVDEACERLLVDTLRTERPDDAILAEEGGGDDRMDANWRWVIDPLDGTMNFAHGYPRFCVSIGIQRDGDATCTQDSEVSNDPIGVIRPREQYAVIGFDAIGLQACTGRDGPQSEVPVADPGQAIGMGPHQRRCEIVSLRHLIEQGHQIVSCGSEVVDIGGIHRLSDFLEFQGIEEDRPQRGLAPEIDATVG